VAHTHVQPNQHYRTWISAPVPHENDRGQV